MTVRIDRVVTRGGDGGQTSLGDGTRVSKHDARIEAIGAVDELNAAIGFARVALPEISALPGVQDALFDLGADLCQPHGASGRCPSLPPEATLWLDDETEALRVRQKALTSFVLPGGSEAAARAHLARTVARRAERRVVALQDPALAEAVRFLNRLSDFLFVLSRHANRDGEDDLLWRPGGWRPETR
ncbi:cob(I)yrinic acid a,c-diamide adenosyltransferase [Acidomonas methanolica]|uniref:Corrinoid adenosyltransferase n=1 Tax=Acidomonas methanolica NBRC 104435 TaxID=1231351 RepID=A0A023D359_ACIMT|nr:cob(I)yrinic acid a,c-diamide adenosyltransferase [Acidomonas methanolica]MBU2654741.1 cob(I)yrinic acid a,c-diamide adenosyltransferase [Acidomonas methanolica]TCS26403.1 cob(I)alamin adenosyltransferase [Acidomonas methanolica]GAJ28524.1 cobalamin adenosyltransferase [Acidomonas methanolica NBRC 104435]GBQ50532.1 cobalamin adenosyltransferase [Acidomonas methanolica]GEK99760.1 cob(I)yrinic acid a,c-diamide adenosyltransferase [Acidomonas methanolica NBRC 104435]